MELLYSLLVIDCGINLLLRVLLAMWLMFFFLFVHSFLTLLIILMTLLVVNLLQLEFLLLLFDFIQPL
uniref:Uncharacterized protein n=1 Tax=Rhizophora mucronata TaxID=61149 RepID=A0A2P2MLF7_RHIMU